MNNHFETPVRCTAAGVTTAVLLSVMVAMAASTLFAPDAPTPNATAAASATHLAQLKNSKQIRKS